MGVKLSFTQTFYDASILKHLFILTPIPRAMRTSIDCSSLVKTPSQINEGGYLDLAVPVMSSAW